MIRILNSIILLISVQVFGQTDATIEFYPLTPIDTIYSSTELKVSERIDSLKSKDYFFSYQDNKYKLGLLITKRIKNNWIVYAFDSDIFRSSNTAIINFQKINHRFVSIRLLGFPSGVCANSIVFFTLLNVETCKTIEFREHHHRECYNNSAEVSSVSECNATININGNTITIKNNQKTDIGVECSESAEYKIEENKLVRIK